jgi:hypothetical protein
VVGYLSVSTDPFPSSPRLRAGSARVAETIRPRTAVSPYTAERRSFRGMSELYAAALVVSGESSG